MTFYISHFSSFRTMLFALLTLILFSCQKNLDYFVADDNAMNTPDTTWYNSINTSMPVITLKNELRTDFSRDNFNVQGGIVNQLNMSSGISASIPSGSITDSTGQPYFGPIQATSMLMNSRGRKISMGISDVSNGQQLASGGCYYFKLSGSLGQDLFLAPNALMDLSFQSSVPFSPDMNVFRGQNDSPLDFNWETVPSHNTVSFSGGAYHANTNLFGFITTSYFVDMPSPQQTNVSLNLPSNYTNSNTIAYIIYDQLPSVIALRPDVNARKFHSGDIANNQPATVVVLSKQGGRYFLGHVSITTQHAGQSGYQEVDVTPTITTLNDMKNYISTL